MLKIYIESVIIFFVIFLAEGLIFIKEFKKSQAKLNEYYKKDVKKSGVIKTTFYYLLFSLIPILRTIVLITKIYITLSVDKYIEFLKEKEDRENANKNI